MSKASIREHARATRRRHRARKTLLRSRRGRRLLHATTTFSSTSNLSLRGLHIKTIDVDRAVDEAISAINKRYSPAEDGGKKMCDDLNACGGMMNTVLITTSAKLKSRQWDFTYDDQFIAQAQGKTVTDFKVAVYGNTR